MALDFTQEERIVKSNFISIANKAMELNEAKCPHQLAVELATEQDRRNQLAAQLADATQQCGAMAETLRDVVRWVVHGDVSEWEKLIARIDALLAGKVPDHPEQPLAMVPKGYVLVPRVLTREMREAFHEAHEEWESGNDWRRDSPDYEWAAMLAAAPKPQGGE